MLLLLCVTLLCVTTYIFSYTVSDISVLSFSKLGAAGEAFFVERVHNPLRRDLATSPLSSPLRDGQEVQEEAGAVDGGRQWEDSTGQDDWES